MRVEKSRALILAAASARRDDDDDDDVITHCAILVSFEVDDLAED